MRHIQKLSLLLVSLLVISAGVLLPSLPEISSQFPSVNPTLVELLGTLPALFTMLTVGFSPRIARMAGYKHTVQIGLIVTLLSGLLPIFTSSFLLLFISRVTFGIGVGLFNPLLFSFSSQLYQGKEFSNMIGFQSAFEGAGGILTSFLVAYLVAGGWKHTLWTYLFIIPIFLFFSLFVPDIQPVEEAEGKEDKTTIDKGFIGYMVLLVILITVYMSVSIKLTEFLMETGVGTATDTGNALALMGLGAMIAGLIFGRNMQIFKDWLLPLAFSGLSLSLFFLANSQQVWLVILLNFTIGLCFRTFIPFLLNKANQTSDGSGEKRTALLLAAFNIGSAFAPISIRLLQHLLGLQTVRDVYQAEAFLVLLIAVGAGLVTFYSRKNIHLAD